MLLPNYVRWYVDINISIRFSHTDLHCKTSKPFSATLTAFSPTLTNILLQLRRTQVDAHNQHSAVKGSQTKIE